MDLEMERSVGAGSQADPFRRELAAGAYFSDDSRTLILNKIQHLSPYCDVLLLSGPPGMGKTTLLRRFLDQAQEGWRVGLLEAGLLMSERDLLRQIVRVLDIRLEASGQDKQSMFDATANFLQALGRSGRRGILIIDDAQNLAPELLLMVDDLLAQSGNALGVVFSAEEEFSAMLADSPHLHAKLAYTLELEPLSGEGVAEYIELRLKAAGAAVFESLFDEAVIRRICEESGGIPGRINEVASDIWQRQQAARGGARSLMNWGLIAGGVLIIAAVLVWQNDINRLVSGPSEKADEAGSIEAPAGGIAREEAAVVAPSPQKPMPEDPDALFMPRPGTEQSAPPPELSLPKPQVAAEGGEASPGQPPVQKAEKQPVPSPQPKAEPAPKPKPKPKPASQVVAGETWLQRQDGAYFTLQVMALQDVAKVKAFVRERNLTGNSAIYYIKRKDGRLAVLVYGSYPDRARALQAARQVQGWTGGQPWIRSFASVRSDLDLPR